MREIRLEMRESSTVTPGPVRLGGRPHTVQSQARAFPALCRALGPLLADRLRLVLPCDEVLLGTVTPTGGQGDM